MLVMIGHARNLFLLEGDDGKPAGAIELILIGLEKQYDVDAEGNDTQKRHAAVTQRMIVSAEAARNLAAGLTAFAAEADALESRTTIAPAKE